MIEYKCPNCGNSVSTQTPLGKVTCPYCGCTYTTGYAGTTPPPPPPYGQDTNQQPDGQQPLYEQQQYAQNPYQQYGQYSYQPQPNTQNDDVFSNGPSGKSRGVAGLLAIFLGGLGIHYFYLGKTTPGIVFLLITVLSCTVLAIIPLVISIVQGITFFTMTQEDFEKKYVNTPSSFPLF